MIPKHAEIDSENKAIALHRNCQEWLTANHFAMEELNFIDKLLHSNVFEPATPNLFERLQDYLGRLAKSKTQFIELDGLIHKHERHLGGFLESNIIPQDTELDENHLQLEQKLRDLFGKFGMLKSEIFNYTGGVLKKHGR